MPAEPFTKASCNFQTDKFLVALFKGIGDQQPTHWFAVDHDSEDRDRPDESQIEALIKEHEANSVQVYGRLDYIKSSEDWRQRHYLAVR